MTSPRRRFRIIKEIAEGGFGKVYLAEQISSDGFKRIVAVKLLHAKWSSHDEVVMRTRDEARLLGHIRHQHIVKVEDLTAIDGKCAIVMEYLEGVDLKWIHQYLKERNEEFPRAALFEIAAAVVSALDAAYNGRPLEGGEPLRVIHRDIKPSNIFVTTAGAVKVLDFGTARANFAEREAKTQALAFGSQGYMAPERMLGEEDTPAADVFSLGIALYELLTLDSFGRIPPRPQKFNQRLQERLAAIPLRGSEAFCNQVRETMAGLLAYDPKDRPKAEQLVETFEQLAQEAGDTALRKFGRTTVTEAKAALPEPEQSDPLIGQVAMEDAGAEGGASGPVNDPSASRIVAGVAPATAAGTVTPADAPAEEGRSGAIPLMLAGGVSLFVILGLGLVLVVVALVVFASTSGGGGTVAPPAPQPVAAPAPAASGARILSPGSGSGEKVKTSLRYGDPAGGQVVISSHDGFKAEWDGKGEFDLGSLPAGRYTTTVERSDGKKVRGKSFTVEPGKGSCSYLFEPASDEWAGGCN